MPRRAKGPRLYFKGARTNSDGRVTHSGKYVIRDGEREVSTGTSELAAAERALVDYIDKKRDPRLEGGQNPYVADVIALYLADKVLTKGLNKDQMRDAKGRIARLRDAFGQKRALSLVPSDFRNYARERGKAARRDLEDLRAAFNYAVSEHVLPRPVAITMPGKYESRSRWLTRQEMARLLRAAWRQKQAGSKRHTARHVARFIIVALYTGSRAGVICGAAIGPTVGRGYIDLETGMFYRQARGKTQTKKRAPTIPLPEPLLAHIRRWNEASKRTAGRPLRSVVEWNGKPVGRISKAFRAVREAAGLDAEVVPHTIRHSVVSWALQGGADRFELGGYVGLSQETMERVYGHHDLKRSARVAGAMRGRTKSERPSFAPDTPERKENDGQVKAG